MSDNMDNLLDETLDDLADLPQVAPFPAGAHIAQMHILPREKKPGAYLVKFTLKNTLELSTPTDTPPKEGDQALMNVFTMKKEGGKNEFGQGQLKMLLTPIAQRMGLNRVGDILEAIKADGVEVAVVTGVQKSKDPQYQDAMTIKKIELT